MKENHLFTFNQFLLFLAVARACVQLSVRREGGERRPALSGAVRKYICQQRGRDRSERKEAAVTIAFYLLMVLDCSCLGKSLPRGKSGKVWEDGPSCNIYGSYPLLTAPRWGCSAKTAAGARPVFIPTQQNQLLEFAPICSSHRLAGVAAEEHLSHRDHSSQDEGSW